MMTQVGWQFLEEDQPGNEQFFRGPLEPPGAADDPRYAPVFCGVVAEATGSGKFTGPYVPLEGYNNEWIQVGWQRQDTGDLIRFEAGVAGDPNFKHLYRHVEPPS
jgi:hypothetical protein